MTCRIAQRVRKYKLGRKTTMRISSNLSISQHCAPVTDLNFRLAIMKSIAVTAAILLAVFCHVQSGDVATEPTSVNFNGVYKTAEDALNANSCRSTEWHGFKTALVRAYTVGGECLDTQTGHDEQTACLFAVSVNLINDFRSAMDDGRSAAKKAAHCVDQMLVNTWHSVVNWEFLNFHARMQDMREFVAGDETKRTITTKATILVSIRCY